MASSFIPHPSVRIKGTETAYQPVQCFNPLCPDKSVHMHCPFCVKTESYTDPVILKAHYRVKHVDKGVEFAGLKILRCCEQCDIVGVIKGEKKFKGAHWHCYKCRNGFKRRDEAIKHYRTHFRNPQTTFQIQIAQDINQPPSQNFETEEGACTIPPDSIQVTAFNTVHENGVGVLQRSLDGIVSMPGVGAVETVGLGDSQTIMIIQDDNIAAIHETQEDVDSGDGTDMLVPGDDDNLSAESAIEQLRQRVLQLEQDNAQKDLQIDAITKKTQQQEMEIHLLKQQEQELRMQLGVPKDKSVQEMCILLELQHKELIKQQLKQLEQTISAKNKAATIVLKPQKTRMILINSSHAESLTTEGELLNSTDNVVCDHLNSGEAIQPFTTAVDSHTEENISLVLDCEGDVSTSDIEPENSQTTQLLTNVHESVLNRNFTTTLNTEHMEENNDENDKDCEPLHKKQKTDISVECQNL